MAHSPIYEAPGQTCGEHERKGGSEVVLHACGARFGDPVVCLAHRTHVTLTQPQACAHKPLGAHP
jgi:hypothetical protein